MPIISRFLDMTIYMYWRDHMFPHINIRCAEYRCNIDFNGNILNGSLPNSKYRIIRKWIALHKEELNKNWILIKEYKEPKRIKPWE